ncbi:MAG TPA: flagellar protein FlgN [bacterium]|nr:MAG: FlgN protein [bacterium ADurb.Bin236]HOY63695.1 flagellar protein FlgN [bacterium]HPI77468.1 flagellar protein FlgN [bacterium]
MTGANEKAWAALRGAIDEQIKMYSKLLDVLERKRKQLIKGNTKELAKSTKEENKFVDRLEALEKKRLDAAAACLPGKEGTITLRDVLDAAPEGEKEKLEDAAVLLMEILNSVAAINRANAELVKESMAFIQYNMNLLSSDRTRDNLYEGSGKMRDPGPKKRGIVNREA